MPNDYPKIKEFEALGDGIWRVDWFGAIEKNPPIESEYGIRIIVSRLKIDWKGADTATDSAIDHYTRQSILIGVGQLPLVSIGTFWEKGQRLPAIAGRMVSFDLDITPATTNIAIATSKVSEQTLIPFKDHSISSDGKDSWCVYVAHNDDPAGIIIPAMEIIRFYYATSTLLSKAVFNGDFVFAWNKLVNPDSTGMKGRRCVVHRRKNVEDNDCPTIGRVQNDPEAYKGVLAIINSMMAEHVNGNEAYPKINFPFLGKTTLKARCKQIGWKHKRLLVLSLISCSGPFPYDELEIIADNDGTPANPETDILESEKKTAWMNGKKTVNVEDMTLQSVSEPEIDTRMFKVPLVGERFSAISGMKIIKTIKAQCPYKAGELKTIVTPVETNILGTGDGQYSETGVIPASISVEYKKRKGLSADFEIFVAMLNVLEGNSYPGIFGKLHQFPSESGLIQATLTKAANKRQWSYLDYAERHVRHFMVADIVVGDRHCCLFEVERRPNTSGDPYLAEIVFHKDWHAPNSAELLVLFKLLSGKLGRMKNIQTLPYGLIRLGEGLRHYWKTPEEYAAKVVEKIQEEI